MLDKLTQLHKSKFFKCFLIAIVLVFSYEVSKPKAFVPLAWAGAVLAGMAAEQLITMGVKAVSKQVLKKKADDYAQQALDSGAKFDFMGTNPYRNKDGSITLSPSANDRAKMAGLISGALIGAGIGSGTDEGCLQPTENLYYQATGQGADYISIRNTGVTEDGRHKIQAVYRYSGAVYDMDFDPMYSNFSFDIFMDRDYYGSLWTVKVSGYKTYRGEVTAEPNVYSWSLPLNPGYQNYADSLQVAASVDADLLNCDNVTFPTTMDRVYQPPMDMSSTYQMPNHDLLKDNPITIYNVMPPSEQSGPVTWNEVEDYYNTGGGDFNGIVDSTIDTYLEKGVIADNVYTVGEINNIYTDIGQTEKKEDIKPPVGGVVPVDPVDPPAVPDKDVDGLDHSMWQVMRNTYNYLDDGIDSSLAAMKGITDSASGITTYLGQTMGWLPPEWRAVFTSAFVLGVFAHFLRR